MAEPLANEPIPVDDLPALDDDAFVSVDPRYLRASLAGTALIALVAVVVAGVVASQAEQPVAVVLIGAGVLCVLALVAVLKVLEVRRLAYQLRAHDLSLRSGVIIHAVESLPFTRVQHVNVNRGPIERAIGLATLEVSSAGPNIVIPGLTEADASRIKLLVTQRAGVDLDDSAPLAPPAPPSLPALASSSVPAPAPFPAPSSPAPPAP